MNQKENQNNFNSTENNNNKMNTNNRNKTNYQGNIPPNNNGYPYSENRGQNQQYNQAPNYNSNPNFNPSGNGYPYNTPPQNGGNGNNYNQTDGNFSQENANTSQTNASWINNPNLAGIDPAKLAMLQSLANQGSQQNQNDMMPFLMNVAANSQKSGMSFSKDEMSMIIEVLKMGKSPQEVAKMDKMLNMLKMLKF